MREIVIDTETTGLSYKTGDRVIEVGCVELINHVATNNSLQFYCKVDKEISEGAQRITGITNKFLSDKKYFSDHCDELLKFIDNDPLIIHNADFDVGFINNELSLLGRSKLSERFTWSAARLKIVSRGVFGTKGRKTVFYEPCKKKSRN
jgi:DNA polymerase-3 subunit epsilon